MITNEEPVTLTISEAEYCLKICALAARGAAGSGIGRKTEELCRRIEAELRKPAGLRVSLSDEEKNDLSKALMITALLERGKYDVLARNFSLFHIPVSRDEIGYAVAQASQFAQERGIDISTVQKKLRSRKKIPVRKLYIADLHFYHNNLNHQMDRRGFSGYEEMNAHMIRQWNGHVTKKDEVYILGDFAISRGKPANEILRQLNGKKYLIEGNHDKFLDDRDFDRSQFEWIRPYAEIRDHKRQVILSHYPVFCYNGQYRMTPEGHPLTFMLYGHVHITRTMNSSLISSSGSPDQRRSGQRTRHRSIRYHAA